MELSLRQVAEIFSVPERKVIAWINDDNLPAELVSDQYRFHRAELLEWAAHRHKNFKSSIYLNVNGDLNPSATQLGDALAIGGLLHDIGGADLREVLDTALNGLPVPPAFGIDNLRELILAREEIGSTGIGKGVAIPHPRQPILLTVSQSVVRLCYLRQHLEIRTPDGVPVDKLFLMLCPTAHDHLQLLARLGALLRVDSVLEALNARAEIDQVLEVMREAGQSFHQAETMP